MNFLKKKGSLLLLLLVTAVLCAAFVLVASAESADGTVTDVTADTLAAAWSAAESGDTLRLTADGTYAGDKLSLPAGKTLTLDLGGYTLTASKAGIGSVISSEGNITVKNGTLTVGEGVTDVITFSATKGSATLEGVKLLNAVTDNGAENAVDFKAFPNAIVSLNGCTDATLTDVYISGKAICSLYIANGTTLTMQDSTVRNTLNPVLATGSGTTGRSLERSAIKVYAAAKVTIEDSRIESVYIGIRFDDQTEANKSEFSMTNSVLHVSFCQDITGQQLTNNEVTKGKDKDGNETTKYGHNGGNVYKILMQKGYVNLQLSGVKITGTTYGKGVSNGSTNASQVTYSNCELYMGGWGANVTVTFKGNNYILFDSQVCYGQSTKAYGVTVETNAKVYLLRNNEEPLRGQYTTKKFGVTSEDDLPTLTSLTTPVTAYMRTGADDTTHVKYQFTDILTAKGSATLTRDEVVKGLVDACYAATYNADGTFYSASMEEKISWTIPAGGTLRFMKDVTDETLSTSIGNAHIDLNGHWLSVGGVTSTIKNNIFTIKSGDAYFYTSRAGGGIRLLAIPGDATKSWTNGTNTKDSTGSGVMFYVGNLNTHLHLGYNVNAEGKEEHSDKNFTVISAALTCTRYDPGTNDPEITNENAMHVTVKGGSYYRHFGDYFGTFCVQRNTPGYALTVEDAYFSSNVTQAVVGLQWSSPAFDITFKNCVFDNVKIFEASGNNTGSGTIKLEDCVLIGTPKMASEYNGVSVLLGEGCYYADAYTSDAYKSYFGGNDYDILCTPKTVTVTHLKTLKLAELQSGASQANGTATYTFTKVVTNDHATVTWKNGDKVVAEEKWRTGDVPTFAEREIADVFYLAAYTGEAVNGDATYSLTVKTKKSVLMGNLTLHSNITFNLYFPMDTAVTAVNGEALGETVTIAGTEYYIARLDKTAPKDLYKSVEVTLTLTEGYTCVKTVSLANYARSVLGTNESTEGKTLVLSLLDYVCEVAVKFGGADAQNIAGLAALLQSDSAKEIYERKSWTVNDNVKDPTAGNIVSAALNLDSNPGFAFFLDAAKYAEDKAVTMTVNGTEKTYTVNTLEKGEGTKYYVLIDNIQAASYRKDLTVELEGETLVYNFDTYMAGFKNEAGEIDIPDYANALYSYLLAAEAYLAAQSKN